MNSQDRDESKTRRREEALARRVGDALDKLNPHVAGECPDAEVIAAYAEQALEPAESAQWEGHFAECARCRKILRVLAASADTPLAAKEVAQLGELVSAVSGPVEVAGRHPVRARPRLADWRTRWLAPALGVAAVLAVWFAMRPPWRQTDGGTSETLVAQAPKEEAPLTPAPAQGDRLSRVAPQQKEEVLPAPPAERSQTNAQALNSTVESLKKGSADAGNAMDRVSPGTGEAASSLQQQKNANALPSTRESQASVNSPAVQMPGKAQAETEASASPQSNANSTAAPAAPGPARTEAFANANGGPAAHDRQAGAPQRAANALAVPSPSPQGAARVRNSQDFAALKAAEPAIIQATAPFGSTVWRLGQGGRIERSADGGATWISQTSPILEDWLAGVALSDTVCWAAGSNGSIARTTDGERWERVAPPRMSAGADEKQPDWTGITARDAQSATISSSDGRKFATADGGKTWRSQ